MLCNNVQLKMGGVNIVYGNLYFVEICHILFIYIF